MIFAEMGGYLEIADQLDIGTLHLQRLGVTCPHTPNLVAAASAVCRHNNNATLEDVCLEFVILKSQECMCVNWVEEDVPQAVLFLLYRSCYPSCDLVNLYLRFKRNNFGMSPVTMGELGAYMEEEMKLEQDPSQFCLDKLKATPAANLSQLKESTCENNDSTCMICTFDIEKNQEIYAFNSCPHVFHSDPAQCLGDGKSIVTWLQKHSNCPVCSVPVHIP